MLKTKYDLLIRNGKDRFIVIPEKDFNAMRERLIDDSDFRAIEASKKRQAGSPRISSEDVKARLGIASRRAKRKS